MNIENLVCSLFSFISCLLRKISALVVSWKSGVFVGYAKSSNKAAYSGDQIWSFWEFIYYAIFLTLNYLNPKNYVKKITSYKFIRQISRSTKSDLYCYKQYCQYFARQYKQRDISCRGLSLTDRTDELSTWSNLPRSLQWFKKSRQALQVCQHLLSSYKTAKLLSLYGVKRWLWTQHYLCVWAKYTSHGRVRYGRGSWYARGRLFWFIP